MHCANPSLLRVSDVLVFVLPFTAIGIGWYLVRRSIGLQGAVSSQRSQYYKGLNYLLDGDPGVVLDSEIDRYVTNLEVSGQTLEEHNIIGAALE